MAIPSGYSSELPSGSSSAFEADALALLDSLFRTARRLTGTRADAEDLVQETYLKAFRAADRFKPGTNLRAWLFTILHNTARNRIRDRARDAVTIDSEIVERMAEVGPQSVSSIGGAAGQTIRGGGSFENVGASGNIDTPETLLLRQTLAPDLQAAIDELPEIFRQAVWLRDVEEFSYAEIADMLSIPVGTVMSRISRARHQLFERLKDERPVNA
jgi:RNA polymerase sigma-70 factor (ECF subfamily)